MKRERGFLAFLPKRSIADVNARTSFPFFSFPDSHFVGSSSTARERGNIDFERNGLVELSLVNPRFPTQEKHLGTETLPEELFVVF